MKHFSSITANTAALLAIVSTAASCAAAPAAADPTPGSICDPNPATNPSYDPKFCAGWTQPPTPSSGGRMGQSLDRLLDNPFVVVGGILIAVLVIGGILAHIFGTNDEEAQERGRRIADDHRADQVRAAQAAWNPDPADYDPLGIGVAPPPAPEIQLPPEPVITAEDAQRFGVFGRAVDLIPGSANAVLIARNGSWKTAESAWNEACRAANLGRIEDRQSRVPGIDRTRRVFVPAAELVRVEPQDSGDAVLVVRTVDLSVGADHLAAVTPYLLRTARVRIASRWVRAFSSDEFKVTLSTRSDEAIQQASQPAEAAAPDEEDPWA